MSYFNLFFSQMKNNYTIILLESTVLPFKKKDLFDDDILKNFS
jgi:hypothetical protein